LVALILLALAPGLFAQDGKVFGWKVKSPTATAYLIGSIHLAKPDLYPLDPRLENAFGSAGALVVEVDVTAGGAELAQQVMVKAAYPAGDSIDQHVSQELLQKADTQLQKSGMMLPMFAQFKPWFVAQTVLLMELQRLGFSPTNGIDIYFLGKAKGKKKILEFETADFQIDMLNGLSDREQELFLLYTLKDIDNTEKHVNEIFAAWKQGDAARMEKFLTESIKETPELQAVYRKIVDERNVTMAKKVDAFLKTNDTYFIVVGSAHLVGDNGILNLLKKAGHTIEPL
jgi:uncharacterized protein YbaP (TraB family)